MWRRYRSKKMPILNFCKLTYFVLVSSLSINHEIYAADTPKKLSQDLADYMANEFSRLQENRNLFKSQFTDVSMYDEGPVAERLQFYSTREKRLKHFQSQLASIPEERLPDSLYSMYLDAPPIIDKYLFKRILVIAGERMIPIFQRNFHKANTDDKKNVLSVLGLIKSRKALPIVKAGIDNPDQKVRDAAKIALVNIYGWLKFKPELAQMLITMRKDWLAVPDPKSY